MPACLFYPLEYSGAVLALSQAVYTFKELTEIEFWTKRRASFVVERVTQVVPELVDEVGYAS